MALLTEGDESELDDFDRRYDCDADGTKGTLCWDLLTRVVSVRGDERLLDIGCGRGAFLDVARSHGLRTTGLEPSAAAASVASCHAVIPYPVETLSGVGSKFDLVTMWDVLEHLQDPGAALASVRHILSPRGTLALATPMMGSTYDRLAVLSHRLSAGRMAQLVRMCWSEDHLTRFDRSGLAGVLGDLGFAQVDVQKILMLSLRPDRYAGGAVLPAWTSHPHLNRRISQIGVHVAQLANVHNKLLLSARVA